MTKPIVVSLGELLWDMLPSGKRAGGAPVNFAYHSMMNGAESYSISAVGEDELGDELAMATEKAGIHTVLQLCITCLLGQGKIAILYVVLFKAFVIRGQHTVIRYEKSGDESDRSCHEQKNHKIFSDIANQFPRKPLHQWILHCRLLCHQSRSQAAIFSSFT